MRAVHSLVLLSGCHLVFELEDPKSTPPPPPPPPPTDVNLVFVSSVPHDGDFGGVAGGDQLCNDLALAQELPGTYVAWLSAEGSNAIDRLAGARGWVRTDGQPIVDRPAELVTTGPLRPISFTENGVEVADSVFTGTSGSGAAIQGGTCAGWTGREDLFTPPGTTAAVGNAFTNLSGLDVPCILSRRIYCFGIDFSNPLEIEKATGVPIAFVSRGEWAPTSTRDEADTICAREAEDALLAGTFLAALATTGETIRSRFPTSPVYARPDGIVVGRVLDGALATGINVTADGQSITADTSVWTGQAPSSTPLSSETCTDWTTATEQGLIGDARYTGSESFSFAASSCANSHRIYCLQSE